MYGAIRDLFVECLGYRADRVLTDIAGADGRPDVTVRAESGITGANGQPRLIDWIVLGAKPVHQAFLNVASRERIFGAKAKYITPNTAWFIMVDPSTIVARPRRGHVAAHRRGVGKRSRCCWRRAHRCHDGERDNPLPAAHLACQIAKWLGRRRADPASGRNTPPRTRHALHLLCHHS